MGHGFVSRQSLKAAVSSLELTPVAEVTPATTGGAIGSPSTARAPRPERGRVAIVGNVDIVKFRGWLIEDLSAQGYRVFALAPSLGDADLARLDAAGAEFHPIGLERTGLNPFQDIRHILGLAAVIRSLRVDVVLAHSTKALMLGCLAARLARVPRIYGIVEGLGYAFGQGRELKRRLVRGVLGPMMKSALGACDGVFVLNSDDRDYLVGLGIMSPLQTVTRINGTGLDLDLFAHVPVEPKPARFLLIARLIRDKGVFEYVEAARLVKTKHPEARFRVLGPIDDHPGGIGRDQIAAWEREGLIEYLGVTADVRPVLADCSVFVLPTFYREGLPRTIMEAMALGRAVVATDIAGCRDAVAEGVSGLLVPTRSAPSLAAALMSLVEDPRRVEEMGREGRRRAELLFAAKSVNAVMIAAMGFDAATPDQH